jgi:drug/metabolite transporter (DMT)-like permease
MLASSEPRSTFRGYSLALLAAACWASGGLTAKWLFSPVSSANDGWPLPPLGLSISPTVLSGARALSAFLVLSVFLALTRRSAFRIRRSDLPFLATFGVVGLAGVHFSYFMTISLTNVATAILLEYLAPVLVLIVSVLFLGHRFTWALPAGVVLSILGCALVVGAIGGEGLVVSPLGVAWGLASAVFFAFYSLMGSVASTRFSPYTVLVYGLGFATLFWLALLGPRVVIEPFADLRMAGAILFMAVVSTVVPFAAFLLALRHIPPTNATVTSTVEPLLAGLGAFALFGESFSRVQLVGGVLVIAAIAVVQLPERGLTPILPPPD